MTKLSECRDDLVAARAQLAACQTSGETKDQTIADQKTKIAALEKQVADLEAAAGGGTGGDTGFEQVPAGANLQTVLREAGPGAKLQLPATLKFGQTVTPLPGQILRGPCVITPTAGGIAYGFNCKSNDAENVTLEKLDISGFTKRGVMPWFGGIVRGGRWHHNGEMGGGFDGDGRDGEVFAMYDVETDHNGDTSVLGHGASGVKLFHVKRSKFVNLNTHENVGNGLWWDAECGYAEVVGGESWGNWRKGYFWEKCGGNHGTEGSQPYDGMLVIDGVHAHDNNKDGGAGHAGVYIVASKNAVVKNSTFGNNDGWGVTVRNDADRLTGEHADHPGWETSNVEISDSTNTYNNDKVTIGPDVGNGVRRT